MTAPDIPALRRLMEAATPGPWRIDGRYTTSGSHKTSDHFESWLHHGKGADQEFYVAAVNALPALLAAAEETEKLKLELAVARTQLGERVIAPDRCPMTGLRFFMAIDGIATYGGPHDSYSIPERDEDGAFFRRHYDHDAGGWDEEDEFVPLHIVANENLMAMTARAETAEAKLSALSGRFNRLGEIIVSASTDGPQDIELHAASVRDRLKTAEAKLAEETEHHRLAEEDLSRWIKRCDERQRDVSDLRAKYLTLEARAERLEALVRQMREHESGGYDVLASQIKDELYAALPESAPCSTHAYRNCDFCRPEGVPFVPPSPAKCATCGGSGVTSAPYELDAEDCPACGGAK